MSGGAPERPRGSATTIENKEEEALCPAPSDRLARRLDHVPAAVGVPDRVDEGAATLPKDKPSGGVPDNVHAKLPSPPMPLNEAEYGLPTVAYGETVLSTVSSS